VRFVNKPSINRIEVAAGLIFRGGRILVCQRKEEGAFPLKWEFPGGKIEAGESPAGALRRELREELGIEVGEVTEVLNYKYQYTGISEVNLHFFHVRKFRGEVKNLAFLRLALVTRDELQALDFLDGDIPVVAFLRGAQGAILFTS
jgi:8-oxo-dGTP diphosphatase